MVKEMRSGYTTGACAAAGTKAALLLLSGKHCESVMIEALDGTPLHIPIKEVVETSSGACAEVVKFSGDDPDITNGVSVFTEVIVRPNGTGVRFHAGRGIGTVTKPGLSVPPGEPSINPGPRQLIQNVVEEVLGKDGSADVTISIPASAAFLSSARRASCVRCPRKGSRMRSCR